MNADLRSWLLLTCALLSTACARSSARTLTLCGSSSLQPLAERWAEAYGAEHPEISVSVQGGGSTAGARAALSGAAQIGMVSRSLTATERASLREILVARDGIALIVHPLNPIASLTLEQVRGIYSGKIRDFRALGGPTLPITVITREEGSGTRAAFESLVMRGDLIDAAALVQDSTGTVRQLVSGDPAAIGYISVGLVDATVKALSLDGVAATEASVEDRRYPLARPFLFVVRSPAGPDAASFIAWIDGERGRALTRREGFLPPPKGQSSAVR